MVSQYFKRRLRLQIGVRWHTNDGSGMAHQMAKNINLIVAVHALHDSTDTLKPHTRIHAWGRQFFKGAVFLAIKLHKDVVPNLHIAVAIFFRGAWQTAPNMRAMVIKNFGTRTTRPCVTHRPKIIRLVFAALIVANANDAVSRHTNHIMPNIKGFIIGVVDSHI